MNTRFQSFSDYSSGYESHCYGNANKRFSYMKDDDDDDDDDNEEDNCFKNESDREERLINDWKALDDDTWDVISSLRQKFCQLSKSEPESIPVKETNWSSYKYGQRDQCECHSTVDKGNYLIDYTPESEFLKKIKEQCQILQTRLPCILSALNICFPLNGNDFGRPCSEAKSIHPIERLSASEKKSEHVSRSKKPVRRKKVKKRKSGDSIKCMSENEFEPSLKKPNENSCERCWRFASPARSPVNKPDQRYDPNFRRGHSVTNFEKGGGDLENCAEPPDVIRNEQPRAWPSTNREQDARHLCETSNRSPTISVRQKAEPSWQMGQNVCPKHRCSLESHESRFPAENAFSPPNTQRECPKYRSSVQGSIIPPQPQHKCPKHTGSLQQPESPRPKPRCPIHDTEYSEQRSQKLPAKSTECHQQQKSLQAISAQQRLPQQRCPDQRSPQSVSRQYGSHQSSSPRQKSQPGTFFDAQNSCKQSEEQSHGILCSGAGKKPRPHSFVSGSKDLPCGSLMDDLDVTEYKEITSKPKKPTCSPSPDPCSKAETTKKTTPTCGGCPHRPAKTCDTPKMETIPEKEPPQEPCSTRKSSKDGGGNGSNRKDSLMKDGGSGKDDKNSKNTGGVDKNSKNTGGVDKNSKNTGGVDKNSKNTGGIDKNSKNNGDSSKKNDSKSKRQKGKSSSKDMGNRSACAGKQTNPLDKVHPIRPCKCPPRFPESDNCVQGNVGHELCCHCDWGAIGHQANTFPPTARAGNQTCGCNVPRKSAASDNISPIPKEGATACPYRKFTNRCGLGTIGSIQEDNRRCSRESQNEISTQELLDFSPRKYFVYYMANDKRKNENNTEVLVEELAKCCPPKNQCSRTKDIAEKMKRINEPQSDSMALRFQKGVIEGGNVPQSCRMLYF